MSKHSILPEGEHLRQALRWLSENSPVTAKTVEEAGVRFDLSPLEEEFLLKHFLTKDD